MKYWDTSAIVPLLFEETWTAIINTAYQEDPDQTVWCLTEVEIASALARRQREGLGLEKVEAVRERIERIARRWYPVSSLEPVRSRAIRLLNTHPLHAADAMQLAAALVASEERPELLPFVCLDDRLRDAARREGFPVRP